MLDSLPGCQYRMTSYDTADIKEVDPAYGLQLHNPCFLEYGNQTMISTYALQCSNTGEVVVLNMDEIAISSDMHEYYR